MPSSPVAVGFGRANYAVMRHATGQWQTVSSGVHVCVSSSKQKESHFGNPGVGIGQFIAFVIYLDSFYEIIHKCFNFLVLEGVWMVVGTAKILAKQNGGRLVEIVDSAPFDATQRLLPCYNRDLALSPETCVVNQPSGIGLGRRPNDLGEIPYRPWPIPLGWLTTQVSDDRA